MRRGKRKARKFWLNDSAAPWKKNINLSTELYQHFRHIDILFLFSWQWKIYFTTTKTFEKYYFSGDEEKKIIFWTKILMRNHKKIFSLYATPNSNKAINITALKSLIFLGSIIESWILSSVQFTKKPALWATVET